MTTKIAWTCDELRAHLHLEFLAAFRAGKVSPTEYSDVFLVDAPLEVIAESIELFLQWLEREEKPR